MKSTIFLFLMLICIFSYAQTEFKSSVVDLSKIKYKANLVDEATINWQKIPVLFQMKDKSGTQATCKMGVSLENILFRIEVLDDIHYNDQSVANIYNDDGIQLSIDARGDTTQGMPSNTRALFGPDDNALGVAIAKGKAVGIVWTGEMNSTFNGNDFSVTRDEKKKITTYSIKLSWTKLKTQAFSYPSLGIAVRINDRDSLNGNLTMLDFGEGVDGVPRTGLFETITFANLPSVYSAISGHQSIVWTDKDCIELYMGTSDPNCNKIRINDGLKSQNFELPLNPTSIRFYKIQYYPQNPKAISDVQFSLLGSEEKALNNLTISVVQPTYLYDELLKLLSNLIQKSDNDLFTRHLKSVRSLTMTEWARALIYQDDNQREANDVVKYLKAMYYGFLGDCADWETYKSGKRSMIFSFISKRDQTLQYYIFTLPAQWQQNNVYPFFVELHGAGNPNPLSGISAYLSPSDSKLDLFGYNDVRSYCQKQGLGYHIAPFGRGNSGYIDIGEIDVWEAIEDVESKFRIDENRRYLYGFSMGGGGTFQNAIYRPDYWAAIAIYAGAIRRLPFFEQCISHLNEMPKWIWCGEDDGLFNAFVKMKSLFAGQKIEPIMISTPGIGHSYLDEWQKKGVDWLTQFTRKRPNEFTYYCFDNKHTSCWGIRVEKDSKSNCIPVFQYRIENENLFLVTQNVISAQIDTGEKGLQLKGKIKIIWNEKTVYTGDAGGTVTLK